MLHTNAQYNVVTDELEPVDAENLSLAFHMKRLMSATYNKQYELRSSRERKPATRQAI